MTTTYTHRPSCSSRQTPSCFGGEPVDSALDLETVAAIAKGLGHPARVSIVGLFGDGEARMTGDIVAVSGLAQSTVSEHLRILRDAGILLSHRDGPRIWYCRHRPLLDAFTDAVNSLSRQRV